MIVICCYCVGFDPRDPANKGQSHGICPRCAEKLVAAAGQKKRPA